jgi:glycosyltransferase involved in cell wall biosynthesis
MRTVSVIIPTYNRADLVARAVASADRQTRPPVEIIVVDDASTDGTSEVVNSLTARTPVVYERLKRNAGGGSARNAGILLANGDYVAFLDSDDEWAPDHLETLSHFAAQREGNFVVASSAVVSETNRISPARPFLPTVSNVEKFHFILTGNLAFQTSTLLMPRGTALRFMFDGRLRRHQDWDLIFRMIEDGTDLTLLPRPTTIYHLQLGDHVSRSNSVVPSLRFLARHGRTMSRKSVARFVALEIDGRKAGHLIAARSLIGAFLLGGMTAREFAFHSWRRLKAISSLKR